VNEVERRISERKLFGVGDLESEARFVVPGIERLDVDPDHVSDAFAEHARDAAIATAALEQGLVASKGEPELVDAPQAVASLTDRHRVFAP
jgi:hypothetical protein